MLALKGDHMPFSAENIRRVGEILAFAARTEIMPRFRRLTATQVREKSSPLDLVTEADEVAEAVITTGLKAAFPDAIVIGEEGTHKDPALLQSIAAAELAFIVDPIDGTKNFTANLPLFGVMAAATVRGEIVAGVIYDPVCRDWAYAVLGAGAWVEHEDGIRIALRVASPAPVSRMEGVIGTNFLPEPLRSTVNGNLSRLAASTWFRCAAHEYRIAAAGHCHLLFYYKLMHGIMPQGGYCIGYSAHFDGTAYQPTHFSGGLLYAPDEASWHEARAALLERQL
jgi:fructose-1,6-bisphosphatase/inositol monophosphatase family enzyme